MTVVFWGRGKRLQNDISTHLGSFRCCITCMPFFGSSQLTFSSICFISKPLTGPVQAEEMKQQVNNEVMHAYRVGPGGLLFTDSCVHWVLRQFDAIRESLALLLQLNITKVSCGLLFLSPVCSILSLVSHPSSQMPWASSLWWLIILQILPKRSS